MSANYTQGCPSCIPEDASRAWTARMGLRTGRTIIDESHYRISILVCAACGQAFVSVMTETIDWKDGEDPICRQTIAISPSEAEALAGTDAGSAEHLVYSFGVGDRKCLVYDHPKDEPPVTFWSMGLRQLPHD